MKHLRRLIWHIASRLFVACMVLGLCVVTFYYAMNLSNIQIILKDGMARRAEVVMKAEGEEELTKYFQTSFLERDDALIAVANGLSPYQDYNITGIDHRIDMSFVWMWPWDESIRVEIVERIPHIDGRAKSSKADALVAERGSSALYPPPWQSARYRAILTKENGQWLIKSLTLLGIVE